MKVDAFDLSIHQGMESPDGQVLIQDGTEYTVRLMNSAPFDCDVAVDIDGKDVGHWLVKARSFADIERPMRDVHRFTFHRPNAWQTLLGKLTQNPVGGTVRARFHPKAAVSEEIGDRVQDTTLCLRLVPYTKSVKLPNGRVPHLAPPLSKRAY